MHAFCHDRTAQTYDVVAVRPLSEQVLSTFSTKADAVDLLSFSVTSTNIPWLFKGKLLRRAIDAGLSVELQYAPALDDSESRRKFLCNARQLLSVTSRAKGVVLSSGANGRPMQLRSPYDAANMLALVDAPAEYAKRMISCGIQLIRITLPHRSQRQPSAAARSIAHADDQGRHVRSARRQVHAAIARATAANTGIRVRVENEGEGRCDCHR